MSGAATELGRTHMAKRSLFPEAHFRISELCCLAGSGCCAIYVVSHPGSPSPFAVQMHDLELHLAIAFWIVALFYLEHYLVRRFTTCKLDDRLAFWQSLGSSGLILAGAASIFQPVGSAGYSDRMLFAAAALGELLFVWNVIRSFTREESAEPDRTPISRVRVERGSDNFGWPKSPINQFAIAAGLFAGGGVVSMVLNVPSLAVPLPIGGQIYYLRFGWLGLAAAVPFAGYAQLYRVLTDTYHVQFDDSLNRWHFAVTVVGVMLAILQWERAVMGRITDISGGEPLAAIFALSAIVFA